MHVVFESRNEHDSSPVMNAICCCCIVKDGVAARFLSKSVSRILEEPHVLSKGITLELISPLKYSFNKFSWFHRPTKIS